MAGWTSPDRETNKWEGTLCATNGFCGDGSRLTGITAGAETDPTFQAASGAYNIHLADGTIHFTSGAIWTELGDIDTDLSNHTTNTGIHFTSGAIWDELTGTSSAITAHVALVNEHIDWTGATQDLDTSGDISGALIYGDGTNLTNLPAGTETDPTFQAASGAYNSHLADNTIHFTSGALWSDIDANTTLAHNSMTLAASATTGGLSRAGQALGYRAATNAQTGYATAAHITAIEDNTAELTGTSSAVTAHVALVDGHLNWKNSVGTIHADNYTNTTYTGGNDITLDGTAMDLNTGVSGAISVNTTHRGDSSDPHGATLTQTILSLTSGAITGDIATSGAAYIPNVIFNTTSAGITASNYPTGSVLLVYEA